MGNDDATAGDAVGDDERRARDIQDIHIEAMRRASGIRVGIDGALTYQGRPVENERVLALFQRGLDVREDGAVTLTVGRFWCYPDVDGVARFVRAIRADASGGLVLLLSGLEVSLVGAAIGYAPDDRFYLWFEGVRGPALALRDAHQALAGLVGDDPVGAGAKIGILAAIPRAADERPGNLAATAGLFGGRRPPMRDDA